jgi:hypothetical protein
VRVPRGPVIVRVGADELAVRPRGPVGDVVVVSSADSVYFSERSEVRTAWWEPLHASPPDGSWRLAAAFPRPPGAGLVGEMWLGPAIEIYARVRPREAR